MSSKTLIFINNIEQYILNPIIGLMFAIAVVMFIYGIVEFILGTYNEDKKTAGKKHMIWGVIGMFIMVSAFGIINLLISTWEGIKP